MTTATRPELLPQAERPPTPFQLAERARPKCQHCPLRDRSELCPARTLPHPPFCQHVEPGHPSYRPGYRDEILNIATSEPPASGGAPYPDNDCFIAPIRTGPTGRPLRRGALPNSWHGVARRKPWEYRYAVAVAHLDSPELLELLLATWRFQVPHSPYFVVVDTGSLAKHRPALERLERESEDLELHYLRPRGFRLKNQAVAMAMDVAFAVAQTEFLISTHTDVFPKRRDLAAELLARCDAWTPAVGYKAAGPRAGVDHLLAYTLGHGLTAFHLPTCRALGVSWNFQRSREALRWGWEHCDQAWPDVETGPMLSFTRAGVALRTPADPPPGDGGRPSVLAIGEESYDPSEDDRIEHVRGLTGVRLYHPHAAAQREELLIAAVGRAKARVAEWAATQPTPAHEPPAPPTPVPQPSAPCQPCKAAADAQAQAAAQPAPSSAGEYPSAWQMVKNAAAAAAGFAASGFTTAPAELVEARLAVCRACDRFDADQKRCRECGCYVELKTKAAAEACPLGKWGPITAAAAPSHPGSGSSRPGPGEAPPAS